MHHDNTSKLLMQCFNFSLIEIVEIAQINSCFGKIFILYAGY